VSKFSSGYVDDEIDRTPPHLFLYLVLLFKQKWKQKMDSVGSRTIEHLFEGKYFCLFIIVIVTMSFAQITLDQYCTPETKGEYNYLGPLRGHMFLLCMLCDMSLTS
jgi:hypothetical protein